MRGFGMFVVTDFAFAVAVPGVAVVVVVDDDDDVVAVVIVKIIRYEEKNIGNVKYISHIFLIKRNIKNMKKKLINNSYITF